MRPSAGLVEEQVFKRGTPNLPKEGFIADVHKQIPRPRDRYATGEPRDRVRMSYPERWRGRGGVAGTETPEMESRMTQHRNGRDRAEKKDMSQEHASAEGGRRGPAVLSGEVVGPAASCPNLSLLPESRRCQPQA